MQIDTHRGVKNVLLVHGAWTDGSNWLKVIPRLEADGLRVTAIKMPLTSFEDDVAATKRAIAQADGPVLLVGHSYSGGVITEAGSDPKVAGLVYVAAISPETPETSEAPQPEAARRRDAAKKKFVAAETHRPAPRMQKKTKPSWYIVSTSDRSVTPELQKSVERNLDAVAVPGVPQHAFMLSHPDGVAAFISDVAATGKESS